jgi:penicillin-binding protein 2
MAGKTGTAQVVGMKEDDKRKGDEIPYRFRDHAWFVAYAPAEAPRIAVSVLVEHGGHGSSAAAPIAREIVALYCGAEDKENEEDEPMVGTDIE